MSPVNAPSAKRDPFKLIGTRLDRYSIQEVAGGGGMGIVYRAQHEITKGIVAIKVLRPDMSPNDQSGISLFFEEAVKTTQLNHPFIVKVTGADYTPEGLAFMVMEWLEGHTLSDELHKQGTLQPERVANILDQICEAVTYAHNKNIIHRDLKPGNIMLVRDERDHETIRVLDFGIAKAMANTVGTNTRMAGSYYYISPEQTVAQGRIDRCADIYSLGVMLYQMLTGKVPFEADTDGQIIDMHRTFVPVPLRQINPSIPPGVEEVVLKALAKLPGDRYPNATDLARAFRQAAQLASGAIVVQCTDEEDGSAVTTATVYLNGRHAGQTDNHGYWQQAGLTPRKYLIEIEAPNYERWHVSESVGGRGEVTVPVALKRQSKGELVVYCGVANAEVELDGAKIGKTDQTGRLYRDSIDAGTHTIKLAHPKYLTAESRVEINIWEQTLCELKMAERPRFQFFRQLWRKGGDTSAPVTKAVTAALAQPEAAPPKPDEVSKPTPADPYKTSVIVEEEAVGPVQITALQHCDKCGTQVPGGLKFCTECGTPLTLRGETTNGKGTEPPTIQPATDIEATPYISGLDSKPVQATKPLAAPTTEGLAYVTLPPRPKPQKNPKLQLIAIIGLIVATLASVAAWVIFSRNTTTKFGGETIPFVLATPTATPEATPAPTLEAITEPSPTTTPAPSPDIAPEQTSETASKPKPATETTSKPTGDKCSIRVLLDIPVQGVEIMFKDASSGLEYQKPTDASGTVTQTGLTCGHDYTVAVLPNSSFPTHSIKMPQIGLKERHTFRSGQR